MQNAQQLERAKLDITTPKHYTLITNLMH